MVGLVPEEGKCHSKEQLKIRRAVTCTLRQLRATRITGPPSTLAQMLQFECVPESMRLLIINARSCLSAKDSSSYDYVSTSVDIRDLILRIVRRFRTHSVVITGNPQD